MLSQCPLQALLSSYRPCYRLYSLMVPDLVVFIDCLALFIHIYTIRFIIK